MPGDRPRVLLVEDEPDLQAVVRELLEAEGFEVATANDGRQALNSVRFPPDVIVCDLMMPVMDGLSFLRRYKELPGPHAPVIGVSAIPPYLEKARELGAASTLAKPFNVDELVQRIRGVLGREALPALEPPRPRDEARRLKEIIELRLDQPAPEGALKRLVEHTARVFGVPICLITTVTETRHYWCVGHGVPEEAAKTPESDRFSSICTHAVEAGAALVVQDAAENPFFKDNPWVTGWGIRFYAGVPLMSRLGEALGTLCILDFRPRVFHYFDLELLAALGRRVMSELEWRERRLHPDQPASNFRYLSYVDEELSVLGREGFTQVYRLLCARHTAGRTPVAVAVIDFDGPLRPLSEGLEREFETGFVGRLGLRRLAITVAGKSADELLTELEKLCPKGSRIRVADRPPVPVPVAVERILRDLQA